MPELPKFSPGPHRAFSTGFYPNADFDYEVRNLLGAAAYGATEVGEVLATIDSVPNDDHEHWYRAWHDAGSRLHAAADTASAAGHMSTASQRYLRAATYFAVAVNSACGLESGAEVLLPAFRLHRASWDRFVDSTSHPVRRVEIPYEERTLPGYLFTPAVAVGPRPTLIMVNGSDGAISTMWNAGAASALSRGYNVLMFDGPGQQSVLFEHGTGFRPDWEAVITPIVDFLLGQADVDPDCLALYCISQGGYWGARALAYEHRVAAAILDPGVVDVAASWSSNIPNSLMKLFRAGKKAAFNRDMALGMRFSPHTLRTWNFRSRPYLQNSYFDTLAEVHRYTLSDAEARQITTPLFLADPESEQFWPGQSKKLAESVGGPVVLCQFTAAEGSNFHCQPMARRLTAERMLDWLDDTLDGIHP